MTLRDELLPIFNDIARQIPEDLGLRTNGLKIQTKAWASGTPGSGSFSVTELVLTPKPKIRGLAGREVASSGGLYLLGDLRVGPITPQFTDSAGTRGYTPPMLAPPVTTRGVEIVYVVTGPDAGEYARVDLQTDRAFGYFLVLRRKNTTPGP